jgi:glycosyltransferase involved in cell wall biosynthesis
MDEIKGLVSVSIPFYNHEDFLSEAIESVLAQTYTQWELFLVDDGSNDRSTRIAREFVQRWPEKICYLEHPGHQNRGLTHTRNLGAKRSQGEYLAFLDSDDVWFPHKLEHQVAMMNAHPEAALVYGRSEYWYEWGGNKSEQKDHVPALAPGEMLYSPPALLATTYPFGTYGAPCPSSFLLRRKAFNSVGGFVGSFNPATYQLYEDIAFLTKVYINLPVFVSQRCSERYRCHPQSMWHSTKGTHYDELARRFYFRWLSEYLREHPITDPVTRRAIRRQTWMYSVPAPPFVTRLLRRIISRLSR